VVNVSPWAIIVAASTLDKKFVTKVKIGNNKIYEVNYYFYKMGIAYFISSSITQK